MEFAVIGCVVLAWIGVCHPTLVTNHLMHALGIKDNAEE